MVLCDENTSCGLIASKTCGGVNNPDLLNVLPKTGPDFNCLGRFFA